MGKNKRKRNTVYVAKGKQVELGVHQLIYRNLLNLEPIGKYAKLKLMLLAYVEIKTHFGMFWKVILIFFCTHEIEVGTLTSTIPIIFLQKYQSKHLRCY